VLFCIFFDELAMTLLYFIKFVDILTLDALVHDFTLASKLEACLEAPSTFLFWYWDEVELSRKDAHNCWHAHTCAQYMDCVGMSIHNLHMNLRLN
jgi:hypothetical protein